MGHAAGYADLTPDSSDAKQSQQPNRCRRSNIITMCRRRRRSALFASDKNYKKGDRNQATTADAGSVRHVADAASIGGKFSPADRLIRLAVKHGAVSKCRSGLRQKSCKASCRKGITNAAPDAEQLFAIDHVE
ncbi:MAG TPA: hypothetical protein PLR25_26605, partial [Planctomycetaceae bacterium]|nr:hypothetical protein [Planctomycetaceae bacterium]